ncbi:PAS domain S-box protein [Falsiroseomonas sp.]|uniref:PAS domain S-box protein n=1 Tax=Falsiroseomonas sp. TaxID=2870721 RepID=UPI003F6F219E
MAATPVQPRLVRTSPPRALHGRGLRAHLAGLVLAVLAPAVLVGGASAWHLAESYRHSFEARLQDTAGALALFVGSALEGQVATATALAASPTLGRDDLEGFLAWARQVGATAGGWVVVHDAAAGYRQQASTALHRTALAGPLAGPSAAEVIGRAIESGRPAISNLFLGPGPGRTAVAIAAPARQAGQVTRVVVLALDPERLSERLQQNGPTGYVVASIVDGDGRIVARSREHGRFAGSLLAGWQAAAAAEAAGPVWRPGTSGDATLLTARPIREAPGWAVVVAAPQALYQRNWFVPLAGLAASALAAMALGLLVAAGLAHRVLRPVHALVRRAEAAAAGLPPPKDGTAAGASAAVAEFEVLRLASERAEAALAAREAEFRAIFETAGAGMVEVDAETGRFLRVNRRFCQLVGRSEAALVGALGPADLAHPEDRRRNPALSLLAADGAVEGESRLLRPDGTLVWVRMSAAISATDAAGRKLRVVGVVQDITGRRQAEEARQVLTREVDHRTKNVLAVVQAALRLSRGDTPEAYMRAVEGRIAALARAHTMLAEGRWSGADLGALAMAELGGFLNGAGAEAAAGASLEGPPLRLAPAGAQAIAMVLHELTTNAIRHGALSVPSGQVRLGWAVDQAEGLLRLRWSERGGPPPEGPPAHGGFGIRLVRANIAQLGGTMRFQWAREGLEWEAELPASRTLIADRDPGTTFFD